MVEHNNIPLRLEPLGRILAFKFWELTVADDPRASLSLQEIRSLFAISVSTRQLESALDLLCQSGSFYRSRAAGVPTTQPRKYKIQPKGMMFVESELGRQGSDLSYLRTYGDDVIEEIAGINGDWLTPEERETRTRWEPLELDRGSPAYTEAVTATEQVLDSIEASNGYAVENPQERRGIVSAIQNGLDWLKNREPSRAQISDYLLAPLRFIAVQFARASMGQLATRAIESLIKLINSVS